MKKLIRIVLIIFMFTTINSIILGTSDYVYAKVQTNDSTVTSGDAVKITVSTTTAVSCFKIQLLDAGGLSFESATKSSAFDNGSSNGSTINGATTGNPSTTLATYTFKVPEVTETKKYTVQFSISGMDNEVDTTNISTVTVNPRQTTPPAENTTPDANVGGETTNPTENNKATTTPTITKPSFTEVNKVMYTTGEVNLRDSWSTSSKATKVEEGTELTVTGTSTQIVDKYVWYRVNYKGTTKYIAKKLLTDTKPEEEKGNNANLATLSIEGQEIEPVFDKEITEYTLKIKQDIDELTINATPEDEKATVTIEGNKDLKIGDNTIIIQIKAEDETSKTYTITVTKQETISLGLASLRINGTQIDEQFKSDVYEYEVQVKNIEQLEIEAIANQEGAMVEILGNEDLQEGSNIVTIMVTSQDGTQIATYQIKVINQIEVISDETVGDKSNIMIYAIAAGLGVIILIILIVYLVKHRKQEEYEYEDNIVGELFEKNETIYDEEVGSIEQETDIEKEKERKARINYFLDVEPTIEEEENEDEKPRRKRGKHF